MTAWDVAVVGGGLAGSALGKSMAERGYRVLIIERERRFRDRVRGEFIFPWGVAEAKELGLYEALMHAGGHHPTYWADYVAADPLPPRNMAETTPQRVAGLCIYHPEMQEATLAAAEGAGAEVRRGWRGVAVTPGATPRLHVQGDAGSEWVSPRMIVGADGRAPMSRKWGGFEVRHAPPGNVVAGVLVENVPASGDRVVCMINPFLSRMTLYFPQTESSGRAYLVTRSEGAVRLHGDADMPRFLEEYAASGLGPELLRGATPAGPLATFDGSESYVEHPYSRGVALIGDAAATSDPTWGQGLSLTLRDARLLRDALTSEDDWDLAGNAYAAAHAQDFGKVRTAETWFSKVFLEAGAEAEAIRAHVLPQMETDPHVLPDTLVSGPELRPPTDEHRRKIFPSVAAEVRG